MQSPIARNERRPSRRGGKSDGVALVEFGMTSIVVFLIILVIFDFGLYAYAFLAIQNASRVAALRNSGGLESADDQSTACALAIDQLRGLPGINLDFTSDCKSGRVVVTSELCDSDSPCSGAVSGFDSDPSVKVVVRYTLPDLFHVPNVGPDVITRVTYAKIRAIS